MTIWNVLTFNWGAAAATVAGHALISFLGVPIFALLIALLFPGIIIAYVLPMIPYVMWMAGVCGWIILVCEAMIAVPLWMLAHMTFGGDGLHGRAIEGWGLLFNVVFRPTLMVIGLFLGYFVFDCMSWLIRESFGIAAGFVLQNGWIVTNWIGARCPAEHLRDDPGHRGPDVLPHGRAAAAPPATADRLHRCQPRRSDEAFYQQAAWAPGEQVARGAQRAVTAGIATATGSERGCGAGPLDISLVRQATCSGGRRGHGHHPPRHNRSRS